MKGSTRFARWGWMALVLGLVFSTVIVASACGDDDDDDGGDGDNGSAPAATRGDLKLFDPWVRTTTNDVSAAYLRVENSGASDTLVKATTSISSMVQLHEVITEGTSSKMQEKPGGFPVPADGTLELKPGGFHIMLMNLTQPLKEGDSVELELTFEKAGTVKLTAPVKPAPSMGGMGMESGSMDHGSTDAAGSQSAMGGSMHSMAGSGMGSGSGMHSMAGNAMNGGMEHSAGSGMGGARMGMGGN